MALTPEQIIKTAHEAGLYQDDIHSQLPLWVLTQQELERFASAIEAEVRKQEAQEPIGWTTGIAWRPNTRLQSEQVVKITRDAQPTFGYTIPLYTAPQPAPGPQADSQSAPVVDERDDFEKVFPLPSGCNRVGDGYASTGYSNWAAHTHCERWQGWQARAARARLGEDK